jgi:hypothetical protein
MRATSLYSSNSLISQIRQKLLDASNDAELLWGVSAFNLIVAIFVFLIGVVGFIYVRSSLRGAKTRADLARLSYQATGGKVGTTFNLKHLTSLNAGEFITGSQWFGNSTSTFNLG